MMRAMMSTGFALSRPAGAAFGLALAASIALAPAVSASERGRAAAASGATTSVLLDGSAVPHGIVAAEGEQPMVWFAATQRSAVGEINPASRDVAYIPLGHGAKPRGLARCPNGKLFALDPALNVIHEILPATEEVKRHPMPGGQVADLAGAVCTPANILVFTGYNGWIGKLDAETGAMVVIEALGGRGPSQAVVATSGLVWFASYASNQIIRLDPVSMKQDAYPMPSGVEGPKGLAIDGTGRIWVSAFRSARIARYDPRRRGWDAWALEAGTRPHAVAIDAEGGVLVTDVGRDRLLRFDASTGSNQTIAKLSDRGQARFMTRLGAQVWISESAVDRVTVVDRSPASQ
jgi:virginiamycin B lyase